MQSEIDALDPVEKDKLIRAKMIEIGRKETDVFEGATEAYTNDVIMFNPRRKLMVWVYDTLKSLGKIKPIEQLDQDVKKQMWAFVREICAGKTNEKDRMIEVAKVFYTIEYFINEKQ